MPTGQESSWSSASTSGTELRRHAFQELSAPLDDLLRHSETHHVTDIDAQLDLKLDALWLVRDAALADQQQIIEVPACFIAVAVKRVNPLLHGAQRVSSQLVPFGGNRPAV